jgi:hypothetical protein
MDYCRAELSWWELMALNPHWPICGRFHALYSSSTDGRSGSAFVLHDELVCLKRNFVTQSWRDSCVDMV